MNTRSKHAKLAMCSDDTALRDIRELLQRGFRIKNARGGRSTSNRLDVRVHAACTSISRSIENNTQHRSEVGSAPRV